MGDHDFLGDRSADCCFKHIFDCGYITIEKTGQRWAGFCLGLKAHWYHFLHEFVMIEEKIGV
ncbi:hypothetical protein BAT02nite_32320 [Bacillus atrophaeus]|nr:hypothetical protein BAT02nite_32320 [Bacillus atrophaeus]